MTQPTRDWLRELRHTWPVIERPTDTELNGLTLPLTVDAGDVRVGLDRNGVRRLLVPVSSEDEPEVDTEEGPLQLGVTTYRFGRDFRRYAQLTCSRPDLFYMFDDVLVDVLETLTAKPARPGASMTELVARWRALFGTRTHRLLPLTAQMSLIAELHVLSLTASNGRIAVRTWRGPLMEPHDIVLGDRALEVKAVGKTATSVVIHGLDQLEPPGVPLALVLVGIDETEQGETLPQVIDRVLVTVDDRAEALRRLAMIGYAPVDADRYSQQYAVTTVDFAEVNSEIPRLVPSSFASGGMPAGIEAVTYSIETSALHPSMTRSESLLRDWIRGRC